MNEIIDKSYNRESGELQQFTLIDDRGQPQLVKATPENILLWDPENELPFEGGMYNFLRDKEQIVLSEEDPVIVVFPTQNEYCYILRVNNRSVETTPSQAEAVLRGVKDALINEEPYRLISLHDEIVSNQVRRRVVNELMRTFDEFSRLTKTERGWLVDGFYLVNWEASLYTRHNNPDKGDFLRSGSGVEKTDKSFEFVQLVLNRDITPIEVSIGDTKIRLSEREMLFLSKVKWLLDRREQHPDIPFWKFVDHYAEVDWRSGKPEESAEERDGSNPDL